MTAYSGHSNKILRMSAAKKFHGGAGVGRLVLDDKAAKQNAIQCKYDMVLVERIQGKPKKASGLFIPDEDLPKLHLCKGTYSQVGYAIMLFLFQSSVRSIFST